MCWQEEKHFCQLHWKLNWEHDNFHEIHYLHRWTNLLMAWEIDTILSIYHWMWPSFDESLPCFVVHGFDKSYHVSFPIIIASVIKDRWPVNRSSFFNVIHLNKNYKFPRARPRKTGCMFWCQLKFCSPSGKMSNTMFQTMCMTRWIQ